MMRTGLRKRLQLDDFCVSCSMLVAVPSICDNIFLPSRGLCLSMFGSCYVIPYLYTSYGMSDTHPGFAFFRSYVSSLYNTP